MTSKLELTETVLAQLFDETSAYLDDLQTVLWDVNLGIALMVYDPSNFGLVTNSIPKVEKSADQFMQTWSRYRHCESTASAIAEAYDRYLEDEDGAEYDFDRSVYEAMVETFQRVKTSYDLKSEIYAEEFFWAIKFADPSSEQEQVAVEAFRQLNTDELVSKFKQVSK